VDDVRCKSLAKSELVITRFNFKSCSPFSFNLQNKLDSEHDVIVFVVTIRSYGLHSCLRCASIKRCYKSCKAM